MAVSLDVQNVLRVPFDPPNLSCGTLYTKDEMLRMDEIHFAPPKKTMA